MIDKWKWLLLLCFPLALFAGQTHVESDQLHYDGNTIVLIGKVRVENTMGEVLADKAVLTRDEAGTTRLDFPWIALNSAVRLTLSNGIRIDCDQVFLDYTKMTSYFKGTPRVHCVNEIGEVYANEAQIDYIEKEGNIEPIKITLSGDVRLINQEADQFAVAEFVSYFPEEKLMLLEGKKSRVLFFDRKKNMQLSARSVRAKRNPETNKDSFQGVGDVQFVFGQEELTKLKESFKW